MTQWNSPLSTPSIVQVDFGAWGEFLPGDGEAYCGPTSVTMVLYWLYANGFTQLAPSAFVAQDDPDTVNLELVVAGLCNTSIAGGTSTDGLLQGVSDYLSACGISTITPANTGNPDFNWLQTTLAPNYAEDPPNIVLPIFSVGWFSEVSASTASTSYTNSGGHVLVPLAAAISNLVDELTINNAYPASLFEVPNNQAQNPQKVVIAPVPDSYVLEGYTDGPYTQIICPVTKDQTFLAVLWGGQAWTIDAAFLPSSPGYQPSTWNLTAAKSINTNGGTLTVQAPLAGQGGFIKYGGGTLLLQSDNQLTGGNEVHCGVLASSGSTQTPFGTGSVLLEGGGTLAVGSGPENTMTIASGQGDNETPASQLEIGPGGALQILGAASCTLTVGGATDGNRSNLSRLEAGTLVLAPGSGVSNLGGQQSILVAGSGGNLPLTDNGMVPPYIVGMDTDLGGSGSFLSYAATTGFGVASTVASTTTVIDDATSDMVYQVVDDQSLDVTVQVAALSVCGMTISGSGVLKVGSQSGGAAAGVIVNGGAIACGDLHFGSAEGLLYSSEAPAGTISAPISGSAGFTKFGPGMLIVSADNTGTLSGPITVASGSLWAKGSGSATGTGDILIADGAIAMADGTIAGSVYVGSGANLILTGATVAGQLTLAPQGGSTAITGGTLLGSGTVQGTAELDGAIQAFAPGGTLTFSGSVRTQDGEGATAFYWSLQNPVDDATSAPGVGWNDLVFESSDTIFGTPDSYVEIYPDFTALGGDPDGPSNRLFWAGSHSWQIFSFPNWNDTSCFYYSQQNFAYASGTFDIVLDPDWNGGPVTLTWTPRQNRLKTRERLALQAELSRPRGVGKTTSSARR